MRWDQAAGPDAKRLYAAQVLVCANVDLHHCSVFNERRDLDLRAAFTDGVFQLVRRRGALHLGGHVDYFQFHGRRQFDGDDLALEWTNITTENTVLHYKIYLLDPLDFLRSTGIILDTPTASPYTHSGAAIDANVYYYDVATVDTLIEEANMFNR